MEQPASDYLTSTLLLQGLSQILSSRHGTMFPAVKQAARRGRNRCDFNSDSPLETVRGCRGVPSSEHPLDSCYQVIGVNISNASGPSRMLPR